ncbi:MAG: hypothetical protein CMC95_03715 [Flavobacteriales bacterium]|nr:hypothetical protein [Flavobacteriales bacterium]
MKKITLILCLSMASTFVFSQDVLVKVSPFHFLDGTIYATYERALNNNNSFVLSGGYRLSDNGDEYGWMGELQLRKYVFKPTINSSSESSLAGVYVGLYGNGKYFVETYTNHFHYNNVYTEHNYEYDVKQIEGGVLMGIQILFSEKLSLDFFAGGGLRSSEFDHKPINLEFYSPERGYTGIVPKIGFDIGVSL